MRTLVFATLMACGGVSLMPSSVQACSVVMLREPTAAERRAEARHVIESATAVVDGEVIRPWTESEPALVRVTRVLKGEARGLVLVDIRTDCDIVLDRMGERLRLILVGGPEVFFLPVDYSNAVYEDSLLGSDRRRDWPFHQGNGD